jgi:hypothetical protein
MTPFSFYNLMKRIINTILNIFLPAYIIEDKEYISILKKTIEVSKETISIQNDSIRRLEAMAGQQFTLPMNFDNAVDQINNLTSKAKATFYYRLVKGISNEEIEILKKYIELKTK